MRLRRLGISLMAAAAIAPAAVLRVEATPGRYLGTDEFLEIAFDGAAAEPSRLIIDAALREPIERILGHSFSRLRVRYWQRQDTTAWVLEEIGKTEPITIGVAIEAGKVKSVRVLEFLESRGSEIRHPFFTEQFPGAALDLKLALDRSIDGITGATLSVTAVDKVVRLALVLDRHVRRVREAATLESS